MSDEATPATDDAAIPADLTVVSCVADEAPYLLEWIAWHVLVGVDRFVIFSSGSSDGTDAMLDRLAELGPLEHHRLTDVPDGKLRVREALDRAAKLPALSLATWTMTLMPDEFLDITAGDGTVAALLDACEADKADAIAVPWRIMGSHGQVGFDAAPVTARFCRGSRIEPPEAHGIDGYRTIHRPGAFSRPGPSRPWGPPSVESVGGGRKQVWRNGSGQDVSRDFDAHIWRDQDSYPRAALGFDHACLRRYGVKSRAEFLHRQLREGIPAEGGRAPEGWGAWLLRDINTAHLPPLGPTVLGDAIAELEADGLLSDLQGKARARLVREVKALTDAQPAARLFLETGDTRDPPSAALPARAGSPAAANADDDVAAETPPRLLCIATHPRAGTMWMRRSLREAAKALEIPLVEVYDLADLRSLPDASPAIVVNWRGTFPRALFADDAARIVHIVRDPRDMLVSGAHFNGIAPKRGFGDLHEPRPEFQGLTYQERIRALPDPASRIDFEMRHRHADVAEEMMAWALGRANTFELRYEALIGDTDCAVFRAALDWAGIPGIDVNTVLASYWKHALFGGIAQAHKADSRLRDHVRSAQPGQWRAELSRDLAVAYEARFGPLLRILGYERDGSWVDLCRPAADPATGTAPRTALRAGRP